MDGAASFDVGPPESTRVWRPAPGPGVLIGVALIALCVLPALLGFYLGITRAGSARVFWLSTGIGGLAGAAVLAYYVRALATIRYIFTPYQLRIEWAWNALVVPYREMRAAAYDLPEPPLPPGREGYWPGYYLALIATPGGVWSSVATVPPDRRLLIETTTGVVSISPERPVLFLHELELRRAAALAEGVPANPYTTGMAELPPGDAPPRRFGQATINLLYHQIIRQQLFGDRLVSELIAAGAIIFLIMALYTVYRIDGIFEPVVVHWDANGVPDRTVSPRGIWQFPVIAGVLLIVNTALATLIVVIDRFVARALVAATPLIQIAIFIALLRAVN